MDKILSNVVRVFNQAVLINYLHPWETGQRGFGTGTGFPIQHQDKLIVVTNAHVVDQAQKITVEHRDRTYNAKLVQFLPEVDLALLEVPDLKAEPLVLSNKPPKPGDPIRAYGYPAGMRNTSVHMGHFNRYTNTVYMDCATGVCLQTDTAINRGMSGGPACNLDGEVVGVCVSGLTNYQNYNELIPVQLLQWALAPEFRIGRWQFGYSVLENDKMRQVLKVPEKYSGGVVVTSASKDSGLQETDVILHVEQESIIHGNLPVSSILQLSESTDDLAPMAYYPSLRAPGSKVKLTVCRRGKIIEVVTKLASRIRPPHILPAPREYYCLAGWVFSQAHPRAQEQLRKAGHEDPVHGVYVLDEWLTEFTEAIPVRFETLQSVNGKTVNSIQDLCEIIEPMYKAGKGQLILKFSNTVVVLDMAEVAEQQDQIMADHASGARRYRFIKNGKSGPTVMSG